jgi:sialate O-acetylesterase
MGEYFYSRGGGMMRLTVQLRMHAALGAMLLAGSMDISMAGVSAPGFESHMVLQRDMPIPVWGEAMPGEKILIRLHEQSQSAVAGADGKWSVKLAALAAGGPYAMTLAGKDTLVLADIMIGDVWVCGGQSNMETTVEFYDNLKDSAKSGNIPLLRDMNRINHMVRKIDRPWTVSDSLTARQFSATGFFFAKEIVRTQKIAVGLIEAAIGSTSIERWLDPVAVAADSLLSKDTTTGKFYSPGDLYRNHIAPLVKHPIRGVIWYQGESNDDNNQFYRERFRALIKGWRRSWGQGDFPFCYVQLASYRALQAGPVANSKWASVREAQRLALSLPHTAMAVILDSTDTDIHPNGKYAVGHRLALAARALTYREKGLVHSGPMYHSHLAKGSTLRLRFTQTGGGMVAGGGKGLKGFTIAGADNQWYWADAEMRGDTVIVSNSSVPNPTQARYAWADNPWFSLHNLEGLQASPFQTGGPQIPVAAEIIPLLPTAVPARFGPFGPRDALGRRLLQVP